MLCHTSDANCLLPVWQERASARKRRRAVGRQIFAILTGLCVLMCSIVVLWNANCYGRKLESCVCTRNQLNFFRQRSKQGNLRTSFARKAHDNTGTCCQPNRIKLSEIHRTRMHLLLWQRISHGLNTKTRAAKLRRTYLPAKVFRQGNACNVNGKSETGLITPQTSFNDV